MSHLSVMVREGKKIATALKTDYSGKGDKLTAVVNSAKGIPAEISEKLRNVAQTIDDAVYGNKIEDEYLHDLKQFVIECTEVLAALKKDPPKKTEPPSALLFLIILIIILFMFHNL